MAASPHRPGFDLLGGNRVPREFDRPIAVVPEPPWPNLERQAGGAYTVGVIDTGIVLNAHGKPHEWFGEGHLSMCREDDGEIIGASPGHLADGDGHGTFVAGLILREAPAARLRMWGVLDAQRPRAGDTGGLDSVDDFAVSAAIRALALNPNVHVINLSFGGGVFVEDHAPKELKTALELLDFDRVAVVAAAGNDGVDRKVWPAAFKHVISVGALDHTRAVPGATPPIAGFSNYGHWVKAFASGVRLTGPFVEFDENGDDQFPPHPQQFRGWAQWSGTSFAAATVSGRIAQIAHERGISGAQAAKELLEEAPRIHGGAWIRSVHSP